MQYSKVTEEDVKNLRGIVGDVNVSTDPTDLVTNALDAYPGEMRLPDVVVWPSNTEETSAVLSYANRRRIPVTVRAAATSLTGASVPQHGGIALNVMKMNKILSVNVMDMQVTTQPAVIYEELNKHLAEYGLFFPPDPGSGRSCTIGGMIANNASGIMAAKYGATRDYVLSVKLALPDGKVLNLGCNTFKSSIGYDLIRLIVGSEGTLGVVTEATLRVRPLPRVRRTIAAFFDRLEDAIKSINRLRVSGLEPAAIEFLDRMTMDLISASSGLRFPNAEAMLIIEFHGSSSKGVEEDVEGAVSILRDGGCKEYSIATNEEERLTIWSARKGAYPSIVRACKSPVIRDIIVPLSKLLDTVKKTYELSEKYGVKVSVFGHLADGNVHANWLSDRSDADHWERANKANFELVRYAIEIGGAASAEHGIGVEKKEFMELQHGEALELMKTLKRVFDPNNILNPGIMFDV